MFIPRASRRCTAARRPRLFRLRLLARKFTRRGGLPYPRFQGTVSSGYLLAAGAGIPAAFRHCIPRTLGQNGQADWRADAALAPIERQSMSVMFRPLRLAMLILAAMELAGVENAAAQDNLETQLREQPIDILVRRARILGDPGRGALIFYRSGLACTQCHSAGEGPKRLGPDLSELGKRATALHVVESILDPGKEQLKGYETTNLLLKTGSLITGLIREDRTDSVELVVPGEEQTRSCPRD